MTRAALGLTVAASLFLPFLGAAHGPAHPMPEVKAGEVARKYRLTVETEPARPAAGRETRVTVHLSDAAGKPLAGLEVHHERLAHFLLVSENLEDFQHLHAEDFGLLTDEARKAGRFSFPVTFRLGGGYVVAVDFVDRGKAVHAALNLTVDGPPQPPTAWTSAPVRQSDGVEGRLFVAPDPPEAGGYAEATLSLAAGGTPVTDLEPYLGAAAHVAVFGEGARTSAHVHGEAAGGQGHGHQGHDAAPAAPAGAGPKITFGYALPEPGRYRLFVQFARGDGVVTMPFDVQAVAPAAGGN